MHAIAHILFVIICQFLMTNGENEVLHTKQGVLKGTRKQSRNGSPFLAFYGVPYAQPPLRWARPVKPKSWLGTRDAFQDDKPECIHSDHFTKESMGSEDCLFVNVLTKNTGKDYKKPVWIWIHGGAFIFGGGKIYHPEYLMDEDMVLVVVQYRLNAFGFLSNESPELPGNYGMLDQVEAMKWVQENIADYGGDPNKVTLIGMSAGGASVHYHMLSPLSKGLFRNAISLSGSSLNWWAHIQKPKDKFEMLAKYFNCKNDILKCLRGVKSEDLIKAQGELFFEWQGDVISAEPMNSFSPRSDPESENPFLPQHPLEAMEQGNINNLPYLIGYQEFEGGWRAGDLIPDGKTLTSAEVWKDFLENFDKVAPLSFGLMDGVTTHNAELIIDEIKKEYSQIKNLKDLSDGSIEALIEVLGDTMFYYGIHHTAKLHSKLNKTWLYVLGYPAINSLTNIRSDQSFQVSKYAPLREATHGTDMLLLFPCFQPYMSPPPKKDEIFSIKFIKSLMKFSLNGSTDQWQRVESDGSGGYLYFNDSGEDELHPGYPFQKRMDFWDNLNVYWNYTLQRFSNNDVKTEL